MDNIKENPDNWIDRMEIMSSEMAAFDARYEKRDRKIIANVFAHLLKFYERTIDAFHNTGQQNILEGVKNGLHPNWKRKFESSPKT
jgi:hypothetical protein